MEFYALTGLVNGIVGSVLGLFVYLKNRRALANQTFGLFCLAASVWSYSYFLWQISTTEKSALFWSRGLMAGAVFIAIFYFHFILSFIKKVKEYKGILIFGYLVFTFFFFTNFTSLFVRDVSPKLIFPYWPNPGILYHPFLLLWIFYAIYSIYLLFREFSITTGVLKSQIKYILAGTIIGYAGGITNYLLWYDISVPPFGNWAVSLYLLIVAYSFLKYHLFGIRVILTEILVGLIALVLLIQALLAETLPIRILGFSIFFLFCFIGYLLIRYTHREIRQKEILEERVKERTKELQVAYEEIEKRKADLEKFYRLTVGRELRMVELKQKIKELEEKLKERVNKTS